MVSTRSHSLQPRYARNEPPCRPSNRHRPNINSISICITSLRSVIGPVAPIPTISINDIVTIKYLTARRNVKLIEYRDSQYVIKTIDRKDEQGEWENELKTLLLLQDSPSIIRVEALVEITNPYSPSEPSVVSGFLMEYGSLGTLSDNLEGKGGTRTEFGVKIKWAQEIAEGLRDMHLKGFVHGDLKPQNIVIVVANNAKLIDFAGKGYTEGYQAPEMDHIINARAPWPNSLDIYSFGVLLRELFYPSNNHAQALPDCHLLKNLISACLSGTPNDRPPMSDIVLAIKRARRLSSIDSGM